MHSKSLHTDYNHFRKGMGAKPTSLRVRKEESGLSNLVLRR